MKSDSPNLRAFVRRLRPGIVEHDGVLGFRPIRLFVLAAFFVPDEDLFDAYAYAINDGCGDPEDLDPNDRTQTSRLETAILELSDPDVMIEELLTVVVKCGFSFSEASLVLAATPEFSILGYYDPDEVPAFHAVAVGDEDDMLTLLGEAPEAILSRVLDDHDEVINVIPRRILPWSLAQVIAITQAFAGAVGQDRVARQDLLVRDVVDAS